MGAISLKVTWRKADWPGACGGRRPTTVSLTTSIRVSRVSGGRLWPRAQALGAALRRDRAPSGATESGLESKSLCRPLKGLGAVAWLRPTAAAVGHNIAPLAG